MITLNNIVKALNNFADNHYMLNSFSHGNVEEMDLDKIPDYPLMHVIYTGSEYEDKQKDYNFEVYLVEAPIGDDSDTDKQVYQLEAVSDMEQIAEDLITDIRAGFNIFTEGFDFDEEAATISPIEEESTNVLSGVVLTISVSVPYLNDHCAVPLIGVLPTDPDCGGGGEDVEYNNSDSSFSVTIPGGTTYIASDITLKEVDDSFTTFPSNIDVECSWFSITIKTKEGDVLGTIDTFPDSATFEVTLRDSSVENSDGSYSEVVDYDTDLILPDITVTDSDGTTSSVPSVTNVVCTPGVTATENPYLVSIRRPTYTDGAGDYATLFTAGYFGVYKPTGAIQPMRLGANDYLLNAATPNVFGTTARYTSTDGTASDTGTARFSSYGTGVSGLVIDHYTWILWKNTPEAGTNNWNDAQAKIDALNTAALGGYSSGWIRPTREMYTVSAMPDSNEEIHTSPNLIIDSGSRRYLACESLDNAGTNFGFFVFFTGTETYQTKTTTAGSQSFTVAARVMTLAELEALV